MEFEFEDECLIGSLCGDDDDKAEDCVERASPIHDVVEQMRSATVGLAVDAELPNEEMFVSRRPSIRARAYRELQNAFKSGHEDAWKFHPWFSEMLGDADDGAFAAACSSVAAHYRGMQSCSAHQVASPAWLGMLAERLLRADSAISKVVVPAAADLVAAVLLHDAAAVWEQIAHLFRESPAKALKLLCVCAEEGIACAEEVWPVIRNAENDIRQFLRSSGAKIASDRGTTPPDAVAQLRALCDLLPTIEGKLSLQLGIQVDVDQPLAQLEPQERKPLMSPTRKAAARFAPSIALPGQASRPPGCPQPQLSSSSQQRVPVPLPAASQPSSQACVEKSASSPQQHSQNRGEWDWDNRLAASPVLPKNGRHGDAGWEVLRVLSTASPRSWRERLRCLQEIDALDSDGIHGQALLPHLVLQAEDDHPKVALAALQAISLIMMQLDCLGDFLADRLASAIRNRLREGQARFVQASAVCLTALVRSKVLASGKLESFLMQAVGCTQEAARSAMAAFHAEGLSTPRCRTRSEETLPSLDQLLRNAVSPRRAARRKSVGTPKTNTPCNKLGSRSSSTPCSKPCTPQRGSPYVPSGVAHASPMLRVASPVLENRLGSEQADTPPVLECPYFPHHAVQVNNAASANVGRMQRECGDQGNASSLIPAMASLRTPPRYAQTFSMPSPGEALVAPALVEANARLPLEHMAPSWDVSPLPLLIPPVPPSFNREDESVARQPPRCGTQHLTTPLPRPQLEPPCSSTPLIRTARQTMHCDCPSSCSTDVAPPRDIFKIEEREVQMVGGFAPAPRIGIGSPSFVHSLVGPSLHGNSQFLSGPWTPSRASITRDSPAPVNKGAMSLWQSPVVENVPSFPMVATAPAASPLVTSTVLPDATPSGRETDEAENQAFAGSELRTPIPWMSPDGDSPEQKSFLVSPPSTSNARVKGLCTAAAAGLNALEAGGDPSAWHDALRALAAWRPGADGVRGEAAAEAVVELLLDAAPRLRSESLPEIWRALSELREAPWLSEASVLELAVGQCLSFTEPSVVAAFLVTRIVEGRLSSTACLDGCFERLCRTDASTVKEATRLTCLLEELFKRLKACDLLGDLALPALPEITQWASPRRLASLPGLRTSLEILLRFASPRNISEACWSQLFHLLGDCKETSVAVPPEPLQKPQHQGVRAGLGDPSMVVPTYTSVCDHISEVPEKQLHVADPSEDTSELHKFFARVHRLMGEFAKAKGDQASAVLQEVTQALTRHDIFPYIRAFLQRLLARQRSLRKENTPPHGKPTVSTREGIGEFVDNDYATIRELAHCEGLMGSFPHSLLTHLKRLLGGPAAANTRRAGLACLRSLVGACGPLLLRIVLQQFVANGILLHAAATRGPAQAHARAILNCLPFFGHRSVAVSPTRCASGAVEDERLGACGVPRRLRMVWRALLQGMASRSTSSPGVTIGVCGDPGQLAELLRWLSEDVIEMHGKIVGALESREFLMVIAPALRDRSTSVRAMATKTLHSLLRSRSEAHLREDVHVIQLAKSIKEDVFVCMDAGPPPLAPTFGAGLSRTPSAIARSPSVPASTFEREPISPFEASFRFGGRSASRDHARRTSNSQPRRLRFSPQVERTPKGTDSEANKASVVIGDSLGECSTRLSGTSSASRVMSSTSSVVASPSTLAETVSITMPNGAPALELEQELTAWNAQLGGDYGIDLNVWRERIGALPSRLESACLRHSGQDSAPLVPATLLLCKLLVCRGAFAEPQEPGLLEGALALARAAKVCFGVHVVRHLNSAAAVSSFRSALQALAQLQHSSKSDVLRRVAAPLLMELPPILAGIIDHLEPSVQLIAWIRVAAEVVEDEAADASGLDAASQGWALRFCARCVDRLTVNLPHGGPDFPAWAWEVLSEVMRLHEHQQSRPSCKNVAWIDDCDIWRRALEGAARAVSRQYPEQAREFLRLATCTGSVVPIALEGMLV